MEEVIWRATLAIVLVLAPLSASAAPLAIEAPKTAVGDGTTAVKLHVRASAGVEVKLTADAGTVGAPGPRSGDGYDVDFVPPRVAANLKVTLVATSGKSRTTATIAVQPAAELLVEGTASGPLGLRGPKSLVIGRHKTAEISIAAPAKGAKPPLLFANVGTLSALEPAGADRLRAKYTPPASGPPQVAIVVALSADRATYDWVAVPLASIADVEITSEPNASVLVESAGTAFGPVNTGGDGKSSINVVAPPGGEAKTIATDSLGNRRVKKIDVRVPPFSRVLGLCPMFGARYRIFAVERDGSPAKAPRFEVAASAGSLEAPKPLATGVFEATYKAPRTAQVGDQVDLKVFIAGESSFVASCHAPITGEPPSGLAIKFDRDAYRAGSGTPIQVAIAPTYEGRLPPLRAELDVAAKLGELSTVAYKPDGTATATWKLPDTFAGATSAELTATTRAKPSAASTVSLALRAGPATKLDVSAAEPRVRADGRSTIAIVARVADAQGNPVLDASLAGETRGALTAFTSAGGGAYRASFRAAPAFVASTERLVVREAGANLSSTVAIELIPMRRTLSIGARGGYITNLGKVAGPSGAVDVTVRTPLLGRRVAVGVDAGVYRSRDVTKSGPDSVETKVIAVPLIARLLVGTSLGPVDIYGGGGGGISIMSFDVAVTGGGATKTRSIRPAAAAVLGVDIGLGPGRITVEAGYLRAVANETSVSGNAGGLQATAGYRFDL